MDLARTYVNDRFSGMTHTPGEGQILTDHGPFAIPLLRAATMELYQRLGNITGGGVVIRDNLILEHVTPVHGRWGRGIPDPTKQVSISYNGYFDGKFMHEKPRLPPDFIVPARLWERTWNTNNEFEDMFEVQDGLPAVRQTTAMAYWEWREDRIWMCGSLLPKDLRVRYVATLPLLDDTVADLASVSVPIQDSEMALAMMVARDYAFARGSDQHQMAMQHVEEMTHLLLNRLIRAQQAIDFRGEPYGDRRLNFFPLDA